MSFSFQPREVVNRMTDAEFKAYQRQSNEAILAEFDISIAPPAAVNDAALSSGSGQVRAVGGAPFETLEEVFASLPPGEFVGDVYRVYEAKAVRAVSALPLKKSNLDQFGKLVQKGLTVSYHGVRGRVAKVSRGACCVEYMHFTGRPTGSCEWLDCELVQVVS